MRPSLENSASTWPDSGRFICASLDRAKTLRANSAGMTSNTRAATVKVRLLRRKVAVSSVRHGLPPFETSPATKRAKP